MSKDTIYREDVINTLADMHCRSDEDGYAWIIRSDALARIDAVPSAHTERKTGHWQKISPAGIYVCSECEQSVMTCDIDVYSFCHGCGARMEGTDDRINANM